MAKEISISELARRLDISAATVSRALSGKGRVGRETRKRILDYIEEHDYIPNIHSSRETEKAVRTICVTLRGEFIAGTRSTTSKEDSLQEKNKNLGKVVRSERNNAWKKAFEEI